VPYCAEAAGHGFDVPPGDGRFVRYDRHSGRTARDAVDTPIFSQWHRTTLKFTLFGILFGVSAAGATLLIAGLAFTPIYCRWMRRRFTRCFW